MGDVELIQLRRERCKAKERLSQAQVKNGEIVVMLARVRHERSESTVAADDELERLTKDLMVLTNQQAALLRLVQNFHNNVQEAGSKPSDAAGYVNHLPDAAGL